MDRSAVVFWSIIAVLFGASAFYGLGVLNHVRATHGGRGSLASGDIVQLAIGVRREGSFMLNPEPAVEVVRGNMVITNGPSRPDRF